jgi:hypothetical protein
LNKHDGLVKFREKQEASKMDCYKISNSRLNMKKKQHIISPSLILCGGFYRVKLA